MVPERDHEVVSTRGVGHRDHHPGVVSCGYKITDAKRSRKVGVACNSLDKLKSKGCSKLGFDHIKEDNLIVQLEDGTVVDDEAYFLTLPSNTLFILLTPEETAVTGAEIIYNALKAVNIEYLRVGEAAQRFFTEDMKKKFLKLSLLLTNNHQDRLSAKKGQINKRFVSKKIDDPDWFEGLDTHADTKEKFLFRRSQDRIRGYFYKSNLDLRNSSLYKRSSKAREIIEDVIKHIAKQLTCCEYFGNYFNRKAEPCTVRLCNEDGDFYCKGPWQATSCNYVSHVINPYDNRETRIIFSTWNLDHRIERSRSIVPALLDAANLAIKNNSHINWEYFFEVLFTTKNLKLVHIVCHDKGKHSVECDPEKYLKTSQ